MTTNTEGGFSYDVDNPSRGCAGVSEKELERRDVEYAVNSTALESAYSCMQGVNSYRRKAELLKKLGFVRVKVEEDSILLEEALKTDKGKGHIFNMYKRTFNMIKNLRKNPSKKSKLTVRVVEAFS